MNLRRELLRAEIKSTAFHRAEVKARSKELYNEAVLCDDTSINDIATSLKYSKSSHARSLNIASGLLRGLNYKQVEATCNTKPNATEILKIIQLYSNWADKANWNLDRVRTLLK